jgi:GTP cyclohydrolase II
MGIAQSESIQRVALARLPTQWGEFEALAFERHLVKCKPRVETAVAMVLGDLTHGAPLLRIHSQCLTGELFRRSNSAGQNSRKLLIRWRSLPDSNRCTSL